MATTWKSADGNDTYAEITRELKEVVPRCYYCDQPIKFKSEHYRCECGVVYKILHAPTFREDSQQEE